MADCNKRTDLPGGERTEIICPAYLTGLFSAFAARGVRAWPVGGCIRDSLLSGRPHDWDVAVDCTPDVTVSVGREAGYGTVPTGIRHGTVTVLVPDGNGGRIPVECTTCRVDGEYLDGRRPEGVTFCRSIELDLSRRDFTVNAMAGDVASAVPVDGCLRMPVLDLFGGQNDLANRLIRCVGDPDRRFEEDALRMLRAVRFASRYGFSVEAETAGAVCRHAEKLSLVSRERIRDELWGILASDGAYRGVGMLIRFGLFETVFSGVTAGDMDIGCLARGEGRLTAPDLRLACLLWGLPRASVDRCLTDLRLPSADRRRIERLSDAQLMPQTLSDADLRRLRAKAGSDAKWVPIIRACHDADDASAFPVAEKTVRRIDLSAAAGECVTVAELDIVGNDLTALGLSGVDVGRMLSYLLDECIRDPSQNRRQILTEIAKAQMNRQTNEYTEQSANK